MSPVAVRSAKAGKYGVPVWRVGKPDSVLAGETVVAREALLSIADADHIGAHVAARSEGERVVTQLFECTLPGYAGWQWFAVLARAPRAKNATVSEVGLVPSEASVVSPQWLPWSERVRPEDEEQAEAPEAAPDNPTAGNPTA